MTTEVFLFYSLYSYSLGILDKYKPDRIPLDESKQLVNLPLYICFSYKFKLCKRISFVKFQPVIDSARHYMISIVKL